MSTLSSANITDVNLVLKEGTHMRLCLNMLIFTHNLGNWLITQFARRYHHYSTTLCAICLLQQMAWQTRFTANYSVHRAW